MVDQEEGLFVMEMANMIMISTTMTMTMAMPMVLLFFMMIGIMMDGDWLVMGMVDYDDEG